MIRVITLADYDKTKEFIDALIEESNYRMVFKNYQLTEDLFKYYVSNPKKAMSIFVLNEEGKEVGIGVFDLVPWFNNDVDVRIARIAYLYLTPDERSKGFGKEIKEAFEYWGLSVGATHYSTNKKTDGYQKVETVYMKEII